MASKKYSLLAGLLCLLGSYGFSQQTTTTASGTGYDVADSSVVPSKKLPQYTEFMNGTYNFPPKPKSKWEIGIKGGAFNVIGDVSSKLSPGFGIHLRKALGYTFSMRLNYMYGIGKGLNWQRSLNYDNNPAWTSNGYVPGTNPVFYNYKTTVQDLSLEGLFSLNNIKFHKAQSKTDIYALVGFGAMIYNTYVNANNGSGNYASQFAGVTGFNDYKNRKDVKDQLKNIMDDSYETKAENWGNSKAQLFGQTLRPVAHVGLGFAFKLSNNINLALEDRFTWTGDDLLDGQRWAEQATRQPVLTSTKDYYNYATIGLNFNIGKKAVQPLWWLNPLDYAYQEIRKPRLMILPKPVLPDADGDGITDQFDQEQTPQGCPVDAHGVSLDTDGDGVPDCRDKEKVTPTYCQPVDADGVGKCPCPDSSCFKGMMMNDCSTILGALPSITFTKGSSTISNDAKGLLASIAARLRQSPECRVVVMSYLCASSKVEQQRSWDRVNAVINYLVEKEGISQDRFLWNYGQEGGDCNTVDFRAAAADEQGQSQVPAPHPNLSKHK